jgi:serine protease
LRFLNVNARARFALSVVALSSATACFATTSGPASAASGSPAPYWANDSFYDDPAHWPDVAVLSYKDWDHLAPTLTPENLKTRYAPILGRYGVSATRAEVSNFSVYLYFSPALHPARAEEVFKALRLADPTLKAVESGGIVHTAPLERNKGPEKRSPSSSAPSRHGRSVASSSTPDNDPMSPRQWALWDSDAGINLSGTRTVTRGDGVAVAILDTGYQRHPDFPDNLKPSKSPGYDFVSATQVSNDGDGRDRDASDPGDWCSGGGRESSWHGTKIAGIVGAVTNNNMGLSSVAPGVTVVPVRTQGQCNTAVPRDIVEGLTWATGGDVAGVPANPTPAKVATISTLGSGKCPSDLQAAINAARARGAVVISSAGNDDHGDAGNRWPSNCSGVITVTGTDARGDLASYANVGSVVALAAPGGECNGSNGCQFKNSVWTTSNNGSTSPGSSSYAGDAGTSYAAPQVAATAALMLAAHPGLSPDEVRNALVATAHPFSKDACPSTCGAGILDATAAVTMVNQNATPVTEAEGNRSFEKAQVLSGNPLLVSGKMSMKDGNDWYVITLPAGKQLTAVLMPNSQTGLKIDMLDADKHLLDKGKKSDAGAVNVVRTSNTGGADAAIYMHITLGSGETGTYSLGLTY